MINFLILLLVIIIGYKILASKFEKANNTFDYYFGVPGSGKSTIGAMLYAQQLKYNLKVLKKVKKKYKKHKDLEKIIKEVEENQRRVFSNEDLPLKHAYYFTKEDLGEFDMSNSLLLIDEAGTTFNNRNFKNNFTAKQLRFFKFHRKYNINVAIFSQGPEEIDIKLRALTTRVFLVQKSWFPFFVTHRLFVKNITTNEEENEFENKFKSNIFQIRWVFGPRYWKHFNSWDAPVLEKKKFYTFEELQKSVKNVDNS